MQRPIYIQRVGYKNIHTVDLCKDPPNYLSVKNAIYHFPNSQ